MTEKDDKEYEEGCARVVIMVAIIVVAFLVAGAIYLFT